MEKFSENFPKRTIPPIDSAATNGILVAHRIKESIVTKEEIRVFTQRLPAHLHAFARDEAYRQRISLNEYITSLVKADFEHNEYLQSPEHFERLKQIEERVAEQKRLDELWEAGAKQREEEAEETLRRLHEELQQHVKEEVARQVAEILKQQ
jgi:hypothetical protein